MTKRFYVPKRRELIEGNGFVKGGNIHPKLTSTSWADFWHEWDWDGHLKPSVDLARQAGMNTVRLIGDLQGVYEGLMTRSGYLSRLEQLVEYLGENDMRFYWTGGDVRHLGGGDGKYVAGELEAQAELLSGYNNILACDLVNEIAGSYGSVGFRQAVGWAREWAGVIRSVMPDLPITVSTAARFVWDVDVYREFDEFVDFFDFHLYPDHDVSVQAFSPLVAVTDKPILIGEVGGDTRYFTIPEIVAHYDNVRGLAEEIPQITGFVQWAIMNPNCGLYDLDGSEKEEIVAAFEEFPTFR